MLAKLYQSNSRSFADSALDHIEQWMGQPGIIIFKINRLT